MKKIVLLAISCTVVGIIVGLSFNAYAQESSSIPSWIKSTAKFWVNGDVSDSDFIKALQWLINQKILVVPQSVSQNNVSSNITISTPSENQIPITIYDNCQSLVRTDLNNIVTICNTTNFGQKQFKFNLPTALEQGLPPNQAFTFVKGYVYQYGANDFKIGLYDQVGEKNYTVSLWQLP